MTTSNEIRNWKKKADAGDAESAFLIYITHTDPATGAPQDWDTAWRYLNIAFESGHPDATLVMGTQYVTGERIEKDVTRGIELMKRSKALGCQNADDFARMLGVDLNDSAPTAPDGLSIVKMGLSIIERLDALVANGTIDLNQKMAIQLMVNDATRSGDQMAMANIYGILHNETELKKLVANAGNIVGTDSASATYYVEPKQNDGSKKLWICIGILALIFVWAINSQ